MKNPFRFGEIVERENFCNRKEELKAIREAIKNRYSFWLFSPRRFGKTSLILKSFKEIKSVKTIYFDLYNVQTLDDFARKYAQALTLNLFNWKEDVKTLTQKLGQYFKNLLPVVSFDAGGNPSFSLEARTIETQTDIDTILSIPENFALKHNKQICIAFDEFQEIYRIQPFLINWMRSSFQMQKSVSYVFLGSKHSLMNSIFNDTGSPFYEFGFKMNINAISKEDLMQFIKNLFISTGKNIPDKTIETLLEKSGCHPHFSQYFASVVWEMIYQGADPNKDDFTKTWIDRIINSQSIIFQNIFDQLNNNQRDVLKAIALSKDDLEIFSVKNREKVSFIASSTLDTTLKSLIQKDIIYKNGKLYNICNPVFKEWIISINL